MSFLSEDWQVRIRQAIGRLDAWLQTMRGPGGYGGPIAHWWESSLLYCGPMADWRYEGIICGYVALYRSTGQAIWLNRARQAGDDLVAAQLPSGKFRNSSFEIGPNEGGTPHEAGVDIGLLELAQLLRQIGDDDWWTYFNAAQRNIQAYLLGELWNGEGFRDMPWNETLVPNKNATVVEALVLYEHLSGQDMSVYLEKAARVILSAQEKTGPRAGGIVHRGTGRHRLAVSIYTARSVCGLLRLYERDPRDEWLDAVSGALKFLRGLITLRGVYFGRYPDGSLIANPRLIAGAGDVLRAMIWGRKYGLASDADIQALVELLVQSQLPSGGIPTGYGFAWRGARREYRGLPEFRDVLPVVGWCDKAFRALSMLLIGGDANEIIKHTECQCLWKGRECLFQETDQSLSLKDAQGDSMYHWDKRSCFPSAYRL